MKKSFALSTPVKQLFYTLYPQRHTGISVCSLILLFVLGTTTSYAQKTTTTLSQFYQDSLMRELGFVMTKGESDSILENAHPGSKIWIDGFKNDIGRTIIEIFTDQKSTTLYALSVISDEKEIVSGLIDNADMQKELNFTVTQKDSLETQLAYNLKDYDSLKQMLKYHDIKMFDALEILTSASDYDSILFVWNTNCLYLKNNTDILQEVSTRLINKLVNQH